MTQQLTSWSFSRYSQYQQCPAKAKYKFLEKRPEPSGPALVRGDMVHKAGEAYLRGTSAKLIPELKAFAGEFKDLRARKRKDPASVSVEETWAFRKDWSRTVYNDWNGCWLRIKVDIADASDGVVRVTGSSSSSTHSEHCLYIQIIA